MNKTAKHTPTPWIAKLGEYNFTGPENGRAIMDSTNGIRICDVDSKANQKRNDYKCADPERDANAAFIVKAVNSHEALVEACQEALKIIEAKWPNSTLLNKLEGAIKYATQL